jgi:hypothetical protein
VERRVMEFSTEHLDSTMISRSTSKILEVLEVLRRRALELQDDGAD